MAYFLFFRISFLFFLCLIFLPASWLSSTLIRAELRWLETFSYQGDFWAFVGLPGSRLNGIDPVLLLASFTCFYLLLFLHFFFFFRAPGILLGSRGADARRCIKRGKLGYSVISRFLNFWFSELWTHQHRSWLKFLLLGFAFWFFFVLFLELEYCGDRQELKWFVGYKRLLLAEFWY